MRGTVTSFRVLVTLILSIACSILVVVWPGWLTDLRAQGYYSPIISFTFGSQTGTIGTPQNLVVIVTQNGAGAGGVPVTWTVSGGTLAFAMTVSGGGVGLTSNILTPTGTTTTVTASIPGGASATLIVTSPPPPLTLTIVSGNNQTGTIGTPLAPLVVSVTQGGAAAPNVPVTWTASGGTLGSFTSMTNAAGQASNTLTPTTPTCQVTASVPGGASVIFSCVAATRVVTIVSGNNQTGALNAPLPRPLVVSVTPPTPVVTVTWEVSGGAILSATSTPTINGLAQITLTLGSTPGPITVRASVTSGGIITASSVTFVVNDGTSKAVEGMKTLSVLGNLATTTATVQSTNIGLRLAARRGGGAGGVSTSGLSLNVAGQSMPLAAAVTSFLSSEPGGGASGDPSKVFGGLGIFLNGQGSFGDQEGTTREPGFKFHTEGLTLGTDYQLTENVVLGAAAGYLHTASDLDQAGGRVKMRGYSLSLFGSYYVTDKFYVDAIATYGWNDSEITRNITDGDLGATAKADPDGNQLAVSVSGGYNFNVGPLTVGPTARVNYINVRIDSFQERGADIFNLRVNSQRIESLATDLGAQASYAISLPWGVLSPLVRAEWEHEFKGGSRLITGSLVADPLRTQFSTPTNNPDRNYVNLAAGLTATLPRGASAFVHYETVLGRAHVTNHSFTAGVRFQFE